jgi:hypothetical protein
MPPLGGWRTARHRAGCAETARPLSLGDLRDPVLCHHHQLHRSPDPRRAQACDRAGSGLEKVDYGNIVTAFQASYGLGLLLVGRWLDKVGTRRGVAIAIAVWSREN